MEDDVVFLLHHLQPGTFCSLKQLNSSKKDKVKEPPPTFSVFRRL